MAAKKMLMVNPRKRRRRTTGTKRKRNPSTARRRRTPARRTTARKSPARRRTRRSAPARRRRRNPAPRGIMGRYIQPAAQGAGTAIGLDVAFGYVPLPDVLSTGMARHATKAAAAIGVGMFLPNLGVVKRATAEGMARGALTVYAADAMREGMATFLPDVPLGYYSPAYVPPGNMNEYLSSAGDRAGATSIEQQGTGFGTMGEYVEAEPPDTSYYG